MSKNTIVKGIVASGIISYTIFIGWTYGKIQYHQGRIDRSNEFERELEKLINKLESKFKES